MPGFAFELAPAVPLVPPFPAVGQLELVLSVSEAFGGLSEPLVEASAC